MSKKIPEKVRLRCELDRIESEEGHRYCHDEYRPYKCKHDPKLEAIIVDANGNALAALTAWYLAAKPKLLRTRGAHLVPGQIQSLLDLPVRQVYIDKDVDVIHLIESENGEYGRVTTRLYPPEVPVQ